MITPRAKKESYTGKRQPLASVLTVYARGDVARNVFTALEIFMESSKISLKLGENEAEADVKMYLDESLADKPEHYQLKVDETGICMSFAEFMGGRNAAASLMQLIRREEGAYCVLEASIDDWPDNGMRGVLLDPARRFVKIPFLKDTMLRMALNKMNLIHMHLMDTKSYTLESKAYPELNDEAHGYYTEEDMREIIEYGKKIGMDLLPEIELTTHGTNIMERIPRLRCETEHVEPSKWAMCVSKEDFYEVFGKLIQEVAAIFPYPILHVGTDEITMYDTGKWPTWYDCKHCRKLAAELGITMSSHEEVAASQEDGTFLEKGIRGVEELFNYTVHRIHKLVTGTGKRMMMWNDNINIAKPCDLPKDILIHFWRIAGKYRGPREGCSMEKFLDAGFEVVNSHYPQTYIEEDFYVPEVPLNTWAPKVYPPSKPSQAKQILGGWPACWENYAHCAYTLPGSLAFYADRLWDETPGVYEKEFCVAVTRMVLGNKVPEGFDVFAALGGYFLPRDTERYHKLEDCRRGYVEKVTISPEEVADTARTLRNIADEAYAEGRQALVYADCVDWVYERMEK